MRRLYTCFMAIIILLLCVSVRADDNIWTTTGPEDARVYTIAINPLNNNQIMIGTIEYGLYVSNDAGSSWEHIESNVLPTTSRQIKYNPLAPDTMFYSTTKGLYKSVNNGADWEEIILPAGDDYEIEPIVIHPIWPNILFTVGPWFSGINYKSIDGGQNWEEMSLTAAIAQDFVVDPIDSNAIYAITESGISYKSIYRSEDLGETWENIHNNLDTTMMAFGLAIDPTDNNVMYIYGYDPYLAGRCMYKTTDRGESWFDITPSILSYGHIWDAIISPFDHNTIYACTDADGVIKSVDGGETWETKNTGLIGRMMKTIVCDETTGILYLGTYFNGIYRSFDGGDSWEKICDGICHAFCSDAAINVQTSNELYVSSFSGIFKTEGGSGEWEFIDALYPDYYNYRIDCLAVDPQEPENIFISVGYAEVYSDSMGFKRSLDGGESWEFLDEGYNSDAIPYDLLIAYYGDDKKVLAATSEGLYVSDDYGESWYLHADVLETYLDALDIYPADNGRILVGGYGLYESADSGLSFTELTIPENDGYINDIAYHPYNSDIFYICVYTEGIYKTIDGGESWENINNDLPIYSGYEWVSGLAINPLNPDNIFISSHHYGVYQSHDGGGSWEEFNEGLRTRFSVSNIIIDPNDTCHIILATDQQSVWEITRNETDIETDIVSLPSTVNISAYPNPFNAATRITFNTNTAGNVKADIYDILGRHVANIVNEYLYPGYHSVVWKPEAISTGQYYLKLDYGSAVNTQKMLYIK